MSAPTTQATPQDDSGPVATDGRGHGAALDNLISMGTGIARLLHDQAHAQAAQQAAALAPQATDGQPAPQATAAQPAPALAKAPAPAASLPDLAAAFDSISRTVRRCIMLAQSLDTPKQPARTPSPSHTAAPDRTAARKRILRAVEDTLGRQDYDDSYRVCDPTEALHAELLDLMDAPDLDRDIESRPIDDIIKDILRDLGLAALPGTRPWKRRTPADIALLNARAAAPSRPAGSTPPRTRPRAARRPARRPPAARPHPLRSRLAEGPSRSRRLRPAPRRRRPMASAARRLTSPPPVPRIDDRSAGTPSPAPPATACAPGQASPLSYPARCPNTGSPASFHAGSSAGTPARSPAAPRC